MKNWKTWKIVLFVTVCLCINIAGKLLSMWLELPLWTDSFGTALCACIGGPLCGAIVGVAGNFAYCVFNPLSAAYSFTSIALGIIIGIAARRKWFDQFYGFMKASSLAVFTALIVSVPVNLLFAEGYTGNKWGDGVIEYLLDKGWPFVLCSFLGQLALEFADKVLTIAAVYVCILFRHYHGGQDDNGGKDGDGDDTGRNGNNGDGGGNGNNDAGKNEGNKEGQNNAVDKNGHREMAGAAGAVLVLCLVLSLSGAEAAAAVTGASDKGAGIADAVNGSSVGNTETVAAGSGDSNNGTEAVTAGVTGSSVGNTEAAAAETGSSAESTDYNDYVQNVYSSNNGLPCGEANDIAQTNDGVLWIGTYAGLYRYNGREFRWVDDYESVKNVNCLYVDEEGRLWIGTNDNGLSIVIREKVVNVLDQSSGLPSNSVRCIIQASDGYYYVGTTGSLQTLAMNNGLKAVNTLDEVNYADSITADENDHVAAVSSDGRLFLMKNGNILCSLRLPEEDELFNCCAFSLEGTLMVGTSTNHIYSYDVSADTFDELGVMTCEDAACINNLCYLSDGTLFVLSDSGVSYMDSNGSHSINTNDFNNSIDNMLYDYQGNLWFTSSRLGLLRLAKSPFKDVYGAIGMDRKVVNTIVFWQGCYYFGTDNGLDVVDKNCRAKIDNELTKKLNGIRIRCMYVDGNDHLWVCTYGNGLMEYSPEGEEWSYNEESGSFGNRARIVTGLSDGTIMAAGDTGVSFIEDHGVIKTIRNEDGLINSMILTLTERSDGSILAGTDGDGIAVIKDGKVVNMITRDDGLTSGVILRTVKDPKSEGVFIVTSNSLCYMEPDGRIRELDKFPYFNNYDIWVKDEDTLFVMSSAGIYVVERDELVGNGEIAWELLDARRGLGTSLTANSWNYYNGSNELFLSCDTGVYIIDVDKYNSDVRSYRMQLNSVRLDGVLQPPVRKGAIVIGRGVNRIELSPEILNYTIQEPNVGYFLEGYDTQWTVQPQNSLNNIIYVNLPAGDYVFHLAIFDSAGERVLEERKFDIEKSGELYEQPGFVIYMLLILSSFLIWFTWFVVQRQLNRQQIKLNMANQTVMAIANAVDAKDVRTHQHSMRVAEYSVLIAKEMNCFKWWEKGKVFSNLKQSAQMHDIGKIAIPDSVLNKVGRLDDEEYAKMRSHVERGAEILKDFTLVENVVDGTRYHHERYDGKGYPDGLKGEEIPLFARIIGVADAFDAMTSNRVYRNHMDTDYVMNEMKRGRGTQFDPDALDAFLRLVDKGVIDLDEIYAQKREDIQQADQAAQEELKRRVLEDKQIQAEEMKNNATI